MTVASGVKVVGRVAGGGRGLVRSAPPGTAELVLNIVWASSGIPQIIRAEGAGSSSNRRAGCTSARTSAPNGWPGSTFRTVELKRALENGRLGNPHP